MKRCHAKRSKLLVFVCIQWRSNESMRHIQSLALLCPRTILSASRRSAIANRTASTISKDDIEDVCECKYDIDENRLLRWRKRFGSKTAPRSSPFGYNRASAEHRPFGKDGAALTQLHLQHICCVGPNLSSTDRPSCSGANHHPDGSTPP